MNESLWRLANLYSKPERIILGLMSGTSLDGLDMALCKILGYGTSTKVEVLAFETAGYPEDLKEDVRSVFSTRNVDLQKVTLLNAKIGFLHGDLINEFLKKGRIDTSSLDCIASHGQTIFHAPKRLHQMVNYPNATLQIGDADHIAVTTGISTISDFRQKHVAAGGEGAPLALYGDCILFTSASENRILLNIGGISNFTFLPKAGQLSQAVCTDVGPGNTLIDALCRKYYEKAFDEDGRIAASGVLIKPLLDALINDEFFQQAYPKTTGPELFNLNWFEATAASLGIVHPEPADLVCTATYFTTQAIAKAIEDLLVDDDFSVYVSGGGANNAFMIKNLGQKIERDVQKLDVLGISGDAKEAVLFAILANETICGSVVATGGGPQVMMGKVSFPG